MKTKQINKLKVKVFEEQELREKLNLDNEHIKLILDYQEKFPELLQNTNEKFCIDARNLWVKLEVGAEYTTWIKRRIQKYKFEQGIDFTRFDKSVKAENTYLNTMEYRITLNMAKELSMVENNDIGLETRKYFITMEEALRNYEEWDIIRGTERQGWNTMKQHIKEWCERRNLDSTLNAFYTREANMLNIALLGYPASEINAKLKNDDKITRNHLDTQINNAILGLQELNSNLLISDLDFEVRKNIINKNCKNQYSYLKDEFLKIAA
ncbi:antA/AntB antirepressor family protein [Clostridium sp.]|uniref:antA/AntB antirepressor family protein n=1 Tax=Clostridium sp. TaxID=1506 RepID=UPI0026161C05|nr:antA/AntB antirepressor family protein [Clostridium sp.]